MPGRIVGLGFIGKNLRPLLSILKRKKAVIYAAGISNSKTRNERELRKEIKYLKEYIKNKLGNNLLIYISTCSLTDNNRNKSAYVRNKSKIEKYISKNSLNYLIIRLPEVVGKNQNKNTVTNFFFNNIKYKRKFILWKGVKRNILGISEVVKLIRSSLELNLKNKIINIANPYFVEPIDIVNNYEKILKKKAFYKIKKIKQKKWSIDLRLTKKIINKSKIIFKKNYLNEVLRKYL